MRDDTGIYLIEVASDEAKEFWWSGPGWYWADECGLLVGRYDTKEEAISARDAHGARL